MSAIDRRAATMHESTASPDLRGCIFVAMGIAAADRA